MKSLPLLELLSKKYPDIPKETLYSYILCREVSVDGGRIANPKERISITASLEIIRDKYVSRGGVKLKHALLEWRISPADKVMLDAGSSTGGFTDCLLQEGAQSVYAVDVGYNQLDYSLRTNPKVVVMERTNIMEVEELDPLPHAAVADLSFRSIRGAAEKILSLTREAWMIALIKPQFEIDAYIEDFNGVVSNDELLLEILTATCTELADEGAGVVRVAASPILGRKGNREFLALIYDMKRRPGTFLCGKKLEAVLREVIDLAGSEPHGVSL
ncbi:MAG: TlyA family RNA methyltransferase [Bacteroidetes bacterium]|nr:TlyA family RNA methyltransferase [Bacteroidota bacterium]